MRLKNWLGILGLAFSLGLALTLAIIQGWSTIIGDDVAILPLNVAHEQIMEVVLFPLGTILGFYGLIRYVLSLKKGEF